MVSDEFYFSFFCTVYFFPHAPLFYNFNLWQNTLQVKTLKIVFLTEQTLKPNTAYSWIMHSYNADNR